MSWAEDPQHGDFVTLMEFWTAQAVLPGFQRKYAAFHDLEAYLVEKFDNVGESEDSIEFVDGCLVNQGFDECRCRGC